MSEETRNLPGLRSELEPGEPTFTLRARDPLAPFMVAMWAALRKGDTASALCVFADTVVDPAYKYRADKSTADPEKVSSASNVAKEMNKWRENRGLEIFDLHTV